MDFQQRSQESNDINSQQNDEENMEFKYMDFYANLQRMEEEQSEFNFNHYEAVLDQRLREIHENNCTCVECDHEYQIHRNPRVNDVPTVYLVTCIKTQHVPIKKRWGKDQESQTRQQTKGKNLKQYSGSVLDKQAQNLQAVNFQIKNDYELNKIQPFLIFNSKTSRQQHKAVSLKKHVLFLSERPWKTQHIAARPQYWLQTDKKEKRPMLKQCKSHKCIQSKSRKKAHKRNQKNRAYKNKLPLNQKQLMMIIQGCGGFEIDDQKKQAKCQSQLCLRNSRVIINQNRRARSDPCQIRFVFTACKSQQSRVVISGLDEKLSQMHQELLFLQTRKRPRVADPGQASVQKRKDKYSLRS